MKPTILLLLLTLSVSFVGCKDQEKKEKPSAANLIKYAKNLSIQPKKQYTLVTVTPSADKTFRYILYKEEKPIIENIEAFIKVPIKSIACTSTSQLPAFSLLHAENKLVGFQGTDWIYNKDLKERVATGLLRDIGEQQGINQELTLKMRPTVLMAYQTPSSSNAFNIVKQAGIQIIYNLDFSETSPLGRAEWMKLSAALLDKNDVADSIFTTIERNYQQLAQKAKDFEQKPTVMTGIMYGDTWYIPGGKNYSSQFIADAGGQYLWSDDGSTKSLALGFENILTKAQQADLWIGTASIATYAALAQTDQRYTYFEPYSNKTIYSYTKRVNEKGSNDYLESGYSRPDLILADYIKMLHAESDTAQSIVFTYFSQLK
jgi:iron complex transport system substrate-binding protein